MKLTGKTRYRTSWRGKIILQVEEAGERIECDRFDVMHIPYTAWRDARIEDLSCIVTPQTK